MLPGAVLRCLAYTWLIQIVLLCMQQTFAYFVEAANVAVEMQAAARANIVPST